MKKFILMDKQDHTDYREEDIEGIRDHLTHIWSPELNDDDEEEENAEFIDEIQKAEFPRLQEMLLGVDYIAFTDEKEMLTWRKNNNHN